jgi:anti-repressor protein
MTELIKVENREGVQTVNARELWQALESKQDFSTWIKARLEGFVPESDFTLHKFVEGKATKIDYHLTIDTAKHLAMLERNDKGMAIRAYFIEVEKQARQAPKLTGMELIAAAVIEAQKVISQQAQVIESQKPAVQFMADVTGSRDSIPMGNVAKIINMGMGRNKLFEFLREHGVLQSDNVPYQKYMDMGWFRLIEQSWKDQSGEAHVSIKTMVYQKGIDGIIKLIRSKK